MHSFRREYDVIINPAAKAHGTVWRAVPDTYQQLRGAVGASAARSQPSLVEPPIAHLTPDYGPPERRFQSLVVYQRAVRLRWRKFLQSSLKSANSCALRLLSHAALVATVGSRTRLKFTLQISNRFPKRGSSHSLKTNTGRFLWGVDQNVICLFVLVIVASRTNPESLEKTDELHVQQLQLTSEYLKWAKYTDATWQPGWKRKIWPWTKPRFKSHVRKIEINTFYRIWNGTLSCYVITFDCRETVRYVTHICFLSVWVKMNWFQSACVVVHSEMGHSPGTRTSFTFHLWIFS